MVKPEWGAKRTCPKCSTRFYDLGKDDPVTCIACGTAWEPEPVLKSKQPMPFDASVHGAAADKARKEKLESDDSDLDLDIDVDEDGDSADNDVDLGGDDDLGVDANDDDNEEEN